MKPEPDTLMPLNNSNTLKTIIQKAVLEVFKLFELRWINIKIKDGNLVPKPFEDLWNEAKLGDEWRNKHPKSLQNTLDFWLKTRDLNTLRSLGTNSQNE